jgi:hypothetical protein
MANSFKDILREASEMFAIAERMAEDEALEPERRETIMKGLIELSKSCRELVITARKRAEEEL